jgi:hypothetical protein
MTEDSLPIRYTFDPKITLSCMEIHERLDPEE